ncbi:alcohol dehydrogenase [Paraburkholderia acidisoli]|uniref:alcohol dehydrogenase n=1 Tax=Paraburkholderia acidisoli TaxID=2571748 RepID=A0A7Z2GPI1_9BURK|nr:alcohol dehydrogenase [Paraburkholderia acidisoli]QGZ65577.1 alcohol dehydrogenase catalytic domain-containing protein [Paraburkholderia acidisoli]
MLSYDVVEHGQPLQARLRETPVPGPREVVIRISHSGLCHSDIHLWKGYFELGPDKKQRLGDAGLQPPLTLGHEALGTVVAVGAEVDEVGVGETRLVFPWIGCGSCWACDAGRSDLCAKPRNIGIALPGGFATHMVVPDAKYLVDVTGLDAGFAATLACSGVTSYAAVGKLPTLRADDWVAVIGCGGVGMTAISILKALGIANIVALDVDDNKLQAAQSLGATKTLRADADGAARALFKAAGGMLAAAIDFVGMPKTFNLGYGALRKGGTLVLCGLHGGEWTTPLPLLSQRSISIMGSYVGTLEDLKATVQLAKDGKLAPTPVRVRDAAEINEALDDLNSGRILGRTVLDFSGVDAQ